MEKKGHLHPITQSIEKMVSILGDMGFAVASGPELETEHYNFDVLNVPADHPSRDMQDTFWIKNVGKNSEKLLLRTHTSPVQGRYMETHKPPIKIIAPGKVFRNEATDATHEAQFYQIEGLYIDENVSLAHLKGTLDKFFKRYFGSDAEVRFRPSFFPFVEPGLEVDVKRGGKWLEVMGAGMVHPNVLNACGIDSKKYRGFAFGGGIDRFVLIERGVPDIRNFYNGDLRFINQF